jgi:hypothetical protein
MSSRPRTDLEDSGARAEVTTHSLRRTQPHRVCLPRDAADVLHASDHARDPRRRTECAASLLGPRPFDDEIDVVLPSGLGSPGRGESDTNLRQRARHGSRRVRHDENATGRRRAGLRRSGLRGTDEDTADRECSDGNERRTARDPSVEHSSEDPTSQGLALEGRIGQDPGGACPPSDAHALPTGSTAGDTTKEASRPPSSLPPTAATGAAAPLRISQLRMWSLEPAPASTRTCRTRWTCSRSCRTWS